MGRPHYHRLPIGYGMISTNAGKFYLHYKVFTLHLIKPFIVSPLSTDFLGPFSLIFRIQPNCLQDLYLLFFEVYLEDIITWHASCIRLFLKLMKQQIIDARFVSPATQRHIWRKQPDLPRVNDLFNVLHTFITSTNSILGNSLQETIEIFR